MKSKKKKNANKKSFFFEDYDESEILFNNIKNKNVKISLNRTTFLFFVFFSLIFIFSIKLTYLSLSPFPEKNFFSQKNIKNFIKERADIVDRNKIILARNIDIYSAGVRPRL